ncbi:MAG TPA: HIT family protein [Burkholderiales bacterium]|nr:HIT family protein [Burkholderiales bacterium]
MLWRDGFCRIVRAPSQDYAGFCRVILNRHAREMTDLAPAERARLMVAVFACESALRELFDPDKINLASLGNLVPHLHWHVIARHADDPHFPDPIWAVPRRASAPPRALRNDVSDARLGTRLAALLAQPAA